MRKFVLSGLMTSLLIGTTYVPQSRALVCLAPDPLCVTVVVGLIGGLIQSISQKNNGDVQALQAGLSSEEAVKSILQDLRKRSKHYTLRMGSYYREAGGYKDLIQRVAKGKVKGNLSLESLYNVRPKLFVDLDLLESVMVDHVGEDVVLKIYGAKSLENGEINWARYAALAQEAALLYENIFIVD